ncbi:MAG: hypothetical protein ACREBH_03195 [Candidatus Micrarchaeaceae archaeon]
MRKYNLAGLATLTIVTALLLLNTAAAQYWFQSGVRGSNGAAFNNGASVTIQTVYQNATGGSLGFWVGEDLSNGAFIQAGYEITNATGYYSSSCVNSTRSVYLRAGIPTWFWEYFYPGTNNNSFCGDIGPDGSAGPNGGFNNYSFVSSGDVWMAYFNGQPIGSVNLGTNNSGPNPPVAVAEYADTDTNLNPMENVTFKNLMFYIGNSSMLVPEGYASAGYGNGSLTSLMNMYGVVEVGNYANYFAVGSGIAQAENMGVLWRVGYTLALISQYGNGNTSNNYIGYSSVELSEPDYVNVSNGVREEFGGWSGTGQDSYTGANDNEFITMYNNITETALWKSQYYLNVSTPYGNATGSGWYDANSTVSAAISQNVVYIDNYTREVFSGWSNNASSGKAYIYLDGPMPIRARWTRQYYLNVSTPYGNATGSGWYGANSIANVSINEVTIPVNQTSRIAFKSWNNGYSSNSISVIVDGPAKLEAIFGSQYLVTLAPENSQGQGIGGVEYYNVSGMKVNSSIFAFANTTYNIEYIYYKNTTITTDTRFAVNSPQTFRFKAPIYNFSIYTQSVFGTPVNASVNITFKNNTRVEAHTGSGGHLTFNNVPYGYVTGYAQYIGVRQSINLSNGVDSYITFFTVSLVAVIVGGMLLIVGVAKITAEYERRKRRRRR